MGAGFGFAVAFGGRRMSGGHGFMPAGVAAVARERRSGADAVACETADDDAVACEEAADDDDDAAACCEAAGAACNGKRWKSRTDKVGSSSWTIVYTL